MPLKKRPDKITSFSDGFVINLMGELIRLRKGMQKNEVTALIGEPVKTEICSSPLNEKLVFKINSGKPVSTRYSLLFTNKLLVYVAKLN
jgi:hypothetical protein